MAAPLLPSAAATTTTTPPRHRASAPTYNELGEPQHTCTPDWDLAVLVSWICITASNVRSQDTDTPLSPDSGRRLMRTAARTFVNSAAFQLGLRCYDDTIMAPVLSACQHIIDGQQGARDSADSKWHFARALSILSYVLEQTDLARAQIAAAMRAKPA